MKGRRGGEPSSHFPLHPPNPYYPRAKNRAAATKAGDQLEDWLACTLPMLAWCSCSCRPGGQVVVRPALTCTCLLLTNLMASSLLAMPGPRCMWTKAAGISFLQQLPPTDDCISRCSLPSTHKKAIVPFLRCPTQIDFFQAEHFSLYLRLTLNHI